MATSCQIGGFAVASVASIPADAVPYGDAPDVPPRRGLFFFGVVVSGSYAT